MTLDSVLDSVQTVEESVESCAREAGFDEDTGSQMAMVAREAAVNAVVHGNKYDAAKHVTFSCELTAEAMTIRIGDEGRGLIRTRFRTRWRRRICCDLQGAAFF